MSTSEALVDIIRKFIIAEDEMHQYDYNAQFLVGAFPHITRIRSSHLFAFSVMSMLLLFPLKYSSGEG